jgi:hypothetical protein
MKNGDVKMTKTTRFSGAALPYIEAVTQGVIEQPIARLVRALNIEGVCGTRASCAGHGWPWVNERRPYVYFVCDLPWSLKLSQMVDELITSKKLVHYWVVEGRHVAEIGLCWTLRSSDARSFVKRRLLNQDFETLAQGIQSLSSEFQKGVVTSEKCVSKVAEDSQDYQSSESLGLGDFAKGIGIRAFGATLR